MRKIEIWVRLKGDFYAWNTHCETLEEVKQTYPIVRNGKNIAESYERDLSYTTELEKSLLSKKQMELFRLG